MSQQPADGTPSNAGPITVAFAVAGAVVGAIVGGAHLGSVAAWVGAALGVGAAQLRAERARRAALSAAIETLSARIEQLETRVGHSAAPLSTSAQAPASASAPAPSTPSPAPPPTPSTAAPPATSPSRAPSRPLPTRPPLAARGPSPQHRIAAALRGLFFGGNTVVRGGVLVLLVGVTLLARWAAEHSLFPIEARLALASLIGLALVGVGFHLRSSRPGFGTTLQGGGLAALYLVSFIAFRMYGLVPVGLAFGLFVVIAAASGALAVLQNALPLIVIASLGGFLAPILASTGSGNHVALFSYYLVLNVSIATIAFARSWRVLNLLAFVCTYGVASVWGVLSYRPEHLASTLPFVFAFLVVFTGEALVFAWRQPPRLKGIVDGTLVFGTPLVSLLALARLLNDVEMGLAMATSGMALFYAGIAVWLWRTAPETLRQLSEAFVALAVGLATMAVPFAFEDSPTTAIVWALEGAGIHWVGVRQSRRLARIVGLALQPLAALAFVLWEDGHGSRIDVALANGRFLSSLALAFAGLAIAREADVRSDQRGRAFWLVAQVAGVWGLLWWSFGVLAEIDQFVPGRFAAACAVAGLGATALALWASARRLRWDSGELMSLLSLPAAALALVAVLEDEPSLLAGGGFLAWPFTLGAIHTCAVQTERSPWRWARLSHAGWLWLAAAVTGSALFGLADHHLSLGADWALAGLGLGLVGVAGAALHAVHRGRGACGRFPRLQFTWGAGVILGVSLLWAFGSNFAASGAVRPLPYLPLLNPVDLAVAAVALATLVWVHRFPAIESSRLLDAHRSKLVVAAAGLAFAWLNAILVRSVVQWAHVPHRAHALWDSSPMQVSFSIAWTLVGLAGMWHSTRHHLRGAWMAFAALLAGTVIKLFVVDLSQLTTPAKIGTFLVVGVLLLVVGYLSPVPPDRTQEPGSPGPDRDLEGGHPDAGGAPPPTAESPSSLLVWLAAGLAAGAVWGATPVRAADVAPLPVDAFAWQRAIVSRSDAALQVVDLPADVYRECAERDLADVRVFDAQGDPVPHAIARPEPGPPSDPRLTLLPLYRMPEGKSGREIVAPDAGYRIDVGLDGGRATLQVEPSAGATAAASGPRSYLVDATSLEDEIVGLEFELAASSEDFLAPLRVESTADLVRYRVLTPRAVIARLSGDAGSEPIEQRRISFDRAQARYLRITWPAEGEAPAIVGVSAVQDEGRPGVARRSIRVTAVEVEPSVFVADLGGWIPVDRIQVDLGAARALVSARIFEADDAQGPWRFVHRGLLYRLEPEPDSDSTEAVARSDREPFPEAGTDAAGTGRNPAVQVAPRPTRFIKLEFDAKGGGAARPAPTVEVSWPAEQLLFLDQGHRPHRLAYGRAGAPPDRFSAPDLLALDRRRPREHVPLPVTATLGPRTELKGPEALLPDRSVPIRTIALWGVLLGSVAFVALLAFRLLREMRAD